MKHLTFVTRDKNFTHATTRIFCQNILCKLAVALELDQFLDLYFDFDHNWWSHSQYSLVISELRILGLHVVSLAPLGWSNCSDHVSWSARGPIAGRHHQLVHKVDNCSGWLVQVKLSKHVTLVASSGGRLACDKSKKLVWSAEAPV